LVVEFVIFVYLAKDLDAKPFQHAIVVLILTSVAGFILLWLANGSFVLSAVVPVIVLSILALVAGTSIGVNLRFRNAGSTNS